MITVEGESNVLVLRCEGLTVAEMRGLQAVLQQSEVIDRTLLGPAIGEPEHRALPEILTGVKAGSVVAVIAKAALVKVAGKATGDLYDLLKSKDVLGKVRDYLRTLPQRDAEAAPSISVEQGIPKRFVIRADSDDALW